MFQQSSLDGEESDVNQDDVDADTSFDRNSSDNSDDYSSLVSRTYITPPYSGSSEESSPIARKCHPKYVKPNWSFKIPIKPYRPKDNELSSLSGYDDSSESDPEEDVEVLPQVYNNVLSLPVEENVEQQFIYKKYELEDSMQYYWFNVRKLTRQRNAMIKELQKQLSKSRFYNDEFVTRINVKIENLENVLNFLIPVLPPLKAAFVSSSNKNTIIRKGFIYERFPEIQWFQCAFKNDENDSSCCPAFLQIDDSGELIDGTFPYHLHHGNDEFIPDEPLPPATPTLLPRAVSTGEKAGSFRKMIKLLDKTYDDLKDWQDQAGFCRVKWEKLKILAVEVEELSPFA
uniref:Uncharacterized protein n=1 Tax=Panagrolaimus sp. ES5 TaxID=591445 RepID=A0AC34G1X5_9BILA